MSEPIAQVTGQSVPLRKRRRVFLLRLSPLERRHESTGITYAQLRETGTAYSKAASDGIRQLALGSFAVVWLFRTEMRSETLKNGMVSTTSYVELPTTLKWALGAFVLALAIDVSQYIYGTVVHLSAFEQYETTPDLHSNPDPATWRADDACVEYSHRMLRNLRGFFAAKVLCAVVGFVALGIGVVCKIFA